MSTFVFLLFLSPVFIGKIPNQNLHNTTETDFIIVTSPHFYRKHNDCRLFISKKPSTYIVVTTDQVFNEFSCGIPDPAAIRDFVKMYYDRYKCTWNQSGNIYCCLGRLPLIIKTGSATIPILFLAYESISSLDPLATYTSDDFFGFLDDNEDINSSIILNSLILVLDGFLQKTRKKPKILLTSFLNIILFLALVPGEII